MDKHYAEDDETDNVIELGSPARRSVSWADLPPREIAPEDWQRYRSYVAEIFGAFGMELDQPGTRETPERYLQALFDATAGLRRRAEAADRVPGRGPRRRVGDEPDHRGPDLVPEPLRAPRAAVPRLRPHRLHRRRADHRHLEADAARPPVRAPLHRAGAARRADRGRARAAGRAAGRRGAPRGLAPLHADARRRGALAHDHDLLARHVRRPRAPARVPPRGSQPRSSLNDGRRRARLRRQRCAGRRARRRVPRPRRRRRRSRPRRRRRAERRA